MDLADSSERLNVQWANRPGPYRLAGRRLASSPLSLIACSRYQPGHRNGLDADRFTRTDARGRRGTHVLCASRMDHPPIGGGVDAMAGMSNGFVSVRFPCVVGELVVKLRIISHL